MSHDMNHPDPDYDDTNSNIEEVSRQRTHERRERSMNKLTRTLGAHPSTILEDHQTTTTKSPIFDNFATTGDKIIVVGRTTHQWDRDSFETDTLASETLTSPMTFAPGSENRDSSLPTRTPTPHTTSDIDSTFSTREDDSLQSPSPEPQTASSSSSGSRMPQLHVSTHSDAVSTPYDDEESTDLNGAVSKPDWLVPLNEVVISIRRNGPSKPQSWTGEWNREMKDVIRDLRRL